MALVVKLPCCVARVSGVSGIYGTNLPLVENIDIYFFCPIIYFLMPLMPLMPLII